MVARNLLVIEAGIMSLVALGLYIATMAPGLTWAHYAADGGDLAIALALGSVPHPTGYPTYLLLATPFTRLPWGDLHTRLNMFSAFCAALSVGTMTWVAGRVFASRWYALLTGALLMTSTLFWSQALVAEVYALFALFVALLVAWGLRVSAEPPSQVMMGVGGLLAGLALGNHLLVMLILPAVLVFVYPHMNGRRVMWGALGLALGLLPYVWLPLRAHHVMPLNWGGASDFAGFWWLVTGRLYRMYLRLSSLPDIMMRVRQWSALALDQFGWWGFPFLVWGLLIPPQGRARAYWWLTLWVTFAYTLWAWFYRVEDWPVYTLPVWMLLAPWVAHGIWQVVPHRNSLVLLGLLVPLATGIAHAPRVDLHADREAVMSVQNVWRALPPHTLVLLDGDRATFGLGYAQFVKGERQDVRLVSRTLWAFPWYRQALHHYYGDLSPTATLQDLISQGHRPVYIAGDNVPGGVRFAPGGPYYHVERVPIGGVLVIGRLVAPAGQVP